MVCKDTVDVYSFLIFNIWFFILLWIYLTVKIFNNLNNLNNFNKLNKLNKLNNLKIKDYELKNIIIDCIV